VPRQSTLDLRGGRGYPVSPSRRTRELRGQQIDSGRLNVPPAAAKVPRRIPTPRITARLTGDPRIVPIGGIGGCGTDVSHPKPGMARQALTRREPRSWSRPTRLWLGASRESPA
jgi:hypothetical protein